MSGVGRMAGVADGVFRDSVMDISRTAVGTGGNVLYACRRITDNARSVCQKEVGRLVKVESEKSITAKSRLGQAHLKVLRTCSGSHFLQ